MNTNHSRDVPELRDYQIADLAFYMANPRCANLSDPGTGKTPSVCVYIYWLWSEKQQRSVWAMPRSLLAKNRDELLRFTHFGPDDIVIVEGNPKQRARQMATDAKVFLMGFNRWSDDWKTLKELHPDINLLAVDEIHMGYKGHTSKRTQEMWKSMRHVERFLAMTGTLIAGRLDSAYPTIHVIEPRYYANHQTFVYQHAILDEFNNVVGWKNHWKLGEIFRRHAIRHTFDQVYGPEAKVIVPELCEMSPAQREAYDVFERDAILELEDDFLNGTEPAVHAIRCRQIMGHPETFGLAVGEKTGKDERLEVHLADHANTGKPLVIFASLVPEQERIVRLVESVGLSCALINGAVTSAKRAQIDEAFRAGQTQVVVGSPATASVGFNWAHVDHIIFASIDYQDDTFLQAYRRAIRGKRETPLLITVLQYANSIDQRIMQIVRRKSVDAHKVDESREVIDLAA